MDKEKLETYTMTQEEEVKWLRNCVRDLQEKNEKLIKLCDKYELEHKATYEEWIQDIKRMNKAIVHIDTLLFDLNRQNITFEYWEEILNPIKNILKGSDNNDTNSR